MDRTDRPIRKIPGNKGYEISLEIDENLLKSVGNNSEIFKESCFIRPILRTFKGTKV